MHMKLHAHAIWHANFEGIQLCQYGCLSTRLDLRNAVLGDEDPTLNKSIVFCAMKMRLVSFVFFQTSFEFIKTAGHSLLLLLLV